ncbi:MAG: alanine racemase, partial [Chloroflexi bacterium]|nr:alanine racemase [Chloroflexota bacterium]
TDRADGHDFITDAVAAGAAGILCERTPDPLPPNIACLVVPDTRVALQSWAAHVLRKYGTQVIGVTGSAGKTVTKEAIAAVLDGPYRVFRNPGNYNDLFGLPIALGQLEPDHQVAVLEMASDRFGEIEALCRIARPRVGVVTSIGPAHLAYFGSLNAIAREKAQLIRALPDDGVAILNADDVLVRGMRPPSGARGGARVIEYGRDSLADVRTERVQVRPNGLRFLVHANGARCWFELRLLGRHHVYAALAAAAVGLAYGLPLDDIAERLAGLDPLPGRLHPLPGVGGSTILDDTYSASVPSVLAALELLERCGQGRRIAVLGDLLELGDMDASRDALRQVGSRVARAADVLVTRGVQAERIAFEARRAGLSAEQVLITYTAPEAARVVAERLTKGDTVLVKGDRQARMEQVVERLMAEPARAEALLVRQDPAWKRAPVLYPEERPTWIEVDLEAIAHNCERIKDIVGPDVVVMAVLKANAYGHGLAPVARTVLRHGATVLGVAALNEAEALRQADIAAPIMILGYTPAWQARTVARLGLTVAVYSLDVAHALSRAGTALHRPVKAHVKVDSGMGRLGLLSDQVLDFLQAISDLPGLDVEGIFTHFATADEAAEAGDQVHLHRQLDTFQKVLRQARAAGFIFRHVHAANSAATLTLPESHFTMVRPGIALYGLHPSDVVRCPPDFRPALSFKTRVAQVKELPPGHCVSYGCIYWTDRPTTVAVLPVGYADGFRRAPAHWGQVLIRGKRVPIIGRVCMDQCMVDVTDVPGQSQGSGVRQGDEAVLIGTQGDEHITAEEAAARLGTINYEVVSGLLVRVPRMY